MTRARTTAALQRDVARQPKACAASTCREQVSPGRIFCPNHWFFLPDWLRTAIIATFRDAEWDLHQQAVTQGADYIDAAFVEAREAGFDELQSIPQPDGTRHCYMTKVLP